MISYSLYLYKKIGNLGNKSLVSHGKSACMVLYAEMHLRKYDQFNNLKVTLKENGSTLKLL